MSEDLKKIMDEGQDQEAIDAILGDAIQGKFDAELKQELEKELKEHYHLSKEGKSVPMTKRKRSNLIYYITALAAGVALLILALNTFTPPAGNAQDLASAYLTESVIYHSGAVKGNTDNQEMRMQAIRAFNAKQYAEAEQYFAQLEEQTEEDTFYSGIASLYNQNYEEAIDKLASVSNMDSTYKAEANWYLAVAYILNGEEASAKEMLSEMGDSSWNYEETQELLDVLQ